MQLLPIPQQELLAAQDAQRLLTAAVHGVLPREVGFCCSVLSKTAAHACNRQTVMGLSVVLFPCLVTQTSSKKQEK